LACADTCGIRINTLLHPLQLAFTLLSYCLHLHLFYFDAPASLLVVWALLCACRPLLLCECVPAAAAASARNVAHLAPGGASDLSIFSQPGDNVSPLFFLCQLGLMHHDLPALLSG
jgi:hypothetical protein